MVRKEVGMHLLAYNLIRGVMAEAARGRDMLPRELSFNGARRPSVHLRRPTSMNQRRSPRIFRCCWT